jgi:hypothetical protein
MTTEHTISTETIGTHEKALSFHASPYPDELRAIRHHVQQFNRLCEASGYTGDILESPDDLQSRISQEINWLDV